MPDQLPDRSRRERLDRDRRTGRAFALMRLDAREMIRRYRPAAISVALSDIAHPAQRFEPPDMDLGERLAGGRIVAQMQVDRVALARVVEKLGEPRAVTVGLDTLTGRSSCHVPLLE